MNKRLPGKIKKVGWGFGLCNMLCEHCYNSSEINDSIPKYTISELITVADKICPYVRDINFGTGELLCNPNVEELIYYITNNYPHIDISITSNGYTILKMNPVDIKLRLSDVDISIDFPEKERHNAFRGHTQAWDWAMNALQILNEIRAQRTITMCLTSYTTDSDLLSILRLADKYGACLRISWFRYAGRGTKKLCISAKRAWEVITFLTDKAVFSSLDSVFAGPIGVKSKPCPAGHASVRINQDMTVTPYPFLKEQRWSGGNILRQDITLSDVYDSRVFKDLRSRNVKSCDKCQFRKTCGGGCVTRAILHNGNTDEVDDYCPVLYGQMSAVERLQGNVIIQKQGNLVHDGYLCTTIMKPNEGV